MIKVGEVYQDKTTNKHYEVLNFFAGQIKISDGKNQYYISEEHFNLIFESPDYKKMYEQQKLRADELERKLNKEVEDGYQMESRWRTEIERADELEKQNDILKHNIRVELDSNRDMYIGMCEQKQRADELESLLYTHKENAKSIPDLIEQIQSSNKRAVRAEKRWSELKDTVNEFHQEAIIEVSKCKDEGDKGIVYACEKILGKISDLEEDGE